MNHSFPRAGRASALLGALALALAAAACSDNNASTPPSATTTTDRFNGTVQVGGFDSHDFTVTNPSEVDTTLISASPPDGVVMGIGIGSGSPCTAFAEATTKTAAGTSVQLAGGVSPGNYCVVVYDVGNQTEPVNYTVTVAHK